MKIQPNPWSPYECFTLGAFSWLLIIFLLLFLLKPLTFFCSNKFSLVKHYFYCFFWLFKLFCLLKHLLFFGSNIVFCLVEYWYFFCSNLDFLFKHLFFCWILVHFFVLTFNFSFVQTFFCVFEHWSFFLLNIGIFVSCNFEKFCSNMWCIWKCTSFRWKIIQWHIIKAPRSDQPPTRGMEFNTFFKKQCNCTITTFLKNFKLRIYFSPR